MIPAESQKIPTESPYPKVPIALILGTFSFFIPQPLSYSVIKKTLILSKFGRWSKFFLFVFNQEA